MCTVTLVPLSGTAMTAAAAFRLACNRDEARTRLPALPPRLVAYGGRRAIHPLDGDRGGTWVAVNDAGLALALLNRYVGEAAAAGAATTSPRPSRGEILPLLLPAASVDEALARAAAIDLSPYAPFRAVLVDGREVGDLAWDGTRRGEQSAQWSGDPLLFTSSGLGDERVTAPRRELFQAMVASGPSSEYASRQDLFHRHSWPDRPHLSVCMRRADACTVSHAVIEVLPGDTARLAYQDGPPDVAGEPVVATLVLAAPRHARTGDP